MLFRPEAFEPLVDEPWDEARVREQIRAIVADTDRAFDPDGLWPAHEWDAWEGQLPQPLTDLYSGAAGVVWALDALGRRGHAETSIDLGATITRALELWRDPPSGGETPIPSPAGSSLLFGETGILVVAWRLAPTDADSLMARIRENVDNEAEELMWGSPGTMLAAHALHGWTGEVRWFEAWRESADALLARRGEDGTWTQQLYGMGPWRSLGPVHGFVGNVHALLQGCPDPTLEREAAAIVTSEAVREDGLANWPATIGEGLEDKRGAIRVQWCHGAPGMVATTAPYLDEELLLAGAELTWQAGAHGAEKGVGICHGTAGNGYALLKAFGCTGDELWLERARRFAVHALAQAERARTENGVGRYSLFTGDVGAALFAFDCLDATARFPVLDGWD
jgi:lantibiotic modifying enzyme